MAIDSSLRVDSIGTCSLCGYYGPGPQHDCDPWIHCRTKATDVPAMLAKHPGFLESPNFVRRESNGDVIGRYRTSELELVQDPS